MTVLTGPSAFTTIGTGLVTALLPRLSPAPQRASMVPAAVAWDACDCGLLAVSVMQQYLTGEFPTQEIPTTRRSGGCKSPFLVGRFVVQIIRCAPNPDYLTPPVAELKASSAVVLSDAWEVLTGTACYLEGLAAQDKIIDYDMEAQEFLGPTGGCVGSEVGALVGIYAGGEDVEL